MKRSNYIAATEMEDMEEFYTEWCRNHVGTYADFIEFMTTPTVEREIFMRSKQANTREIMEGGITRTIISL